MTGLPDKNPNSQKCVEAHHPFKIARKRGSLGGSVVQRLPLAQGVILESWDGVPHRAPVPHQAPCMEPASPSACVSDSASLSLMNK